MSSTNSISSSVDVPTDPETAFKIFTEEVNCWWLQGPINFHDATRTYEMRIEPKLGGRVYEVHDLDNCEGYELATITHWEPGVRLAWVSSIDDVSTQIRFEPVQSGTRVTVVATINGDDRGSTSWVRVTPTWLARWFERRDGTPREPVGMAKLALAVHYPDPVVAAHWLKDTFALSPSSDIPEEYTEHTWIEFQIGNAVIILFKQEGETAGVTHTPWVFVDDLDQQYQQLKRHHAEITEEPVHHGARWFSAKDLAGHQWTFAQAGPRML
ncbi:MAG: VOC family protein [Pseudomonadota bacterium]